LSEFVNLYQQCHKSPFLPTELFRQQHHFFIYHISGSESESVLSALE